MSKGKKQTTREDILIATRKLFTESGYNNVSLRDIAAELDISVGNLAYYYKSKLELIEAAILEKHTQEMILVPATNLQEVDTLLIHTQELQQQHLYYFRQYSQLSSISEPIKKLQAEVFQDNKHILSTTLDNLQKTGLINPPWYDGQYESLISALLFLLTRWHEQDALDKELKNETPDFRKTVWALLTPLLTDKGRNEWSNIQG
ncbi:TetR/AcrR family transcriptional regulator [Breznakia pachnodae]|uniref:AcrR family transcriptional regulator n=1 Tax=Breznakia pachnodae TaxID=265178 RepID=A0ABU0E5B7_9FIRM|nr:TetR/AcrR family transcriptional regulator [Breznakia pachnodae]MDQ0362101.1 AcrR family transcriptional regulator [Breznakia pachnodae]